MIESLGIKKKGNAPASVLATEEDDGSPANSADNQDKHFYQLLQVGFDIF